MSNKTGNEADVLSNRVNVAFAQQQALMRSWLPQNTNQNSSGAKTEQELLKEDEEMSKAGPELLGVGLDAPDLEYDSLSRKTTGASMDRLLEQMLGKKAANKHKASSKAPSAKLDDAQLNGHVAVWKAEESDDEEEGRASMLASTSSRKRQRPSSKQAKVAPSSTDVEDAASKNAELQEEPTQATITVPSAQPARDASISDDEDRKPTKKRGGSYLDQLLAEKANKKKKKKQKH